MRVPRQALREWIDIEDYSGDGALGPVFARTRRVKANVQPTPILMEEGPQMQGWVRALVIIRPEDGPVPIESRITHLGITYRVERMYPIPDSYRPDHYEIQMGRFVQVTS